MTTVFFKINDIQENEVKGMMQEEGYTNKAEFFRFLIKFYKYNKGANEKNFETATKELAAVLGKLNKEGKLTSSLDDQLADV
ncbi:hypothetical protein HZA38_06445 [Candidatus Peregrinibacteria bacterium]|nr:hypothetical protein [Candidatus Peregrinibacteria bacterium]